MNDQHKLFAKLRDMTRNLMQEGPGSATETIQKALQQAGIAAAPGDVPRAPTPGNRDGRVLHDINPPPAGKSTPAAAPERPEPELHAKARAATIVPQAPMGQVPAFVADLLQKLGQSGDGATKPWMPGAASREPLPDGAQFLAASFSNSAGTRQYKLYVPASYRDDGEPVPLVVMLHGCTQDPDDFAAGTQMNATAERLGCLVLYPQQSTAANSSKCWNWFNAADQVRDAGEPSIIVGMTRQIAQQYRIDPCQVYAAGLSAGGAMAAILGTTYPDVYAGVCVHSGLPYGAATDLPSALAAMQGGMGKASRAPSTASAFKGIPIIVFHGDADHTVNQKNGEHVLAGSASHAAVAAQRRRETGQVAGGHAFTRTIDRDGAGKPVAEHWLIHGSGHAWSGGSVKGSFTDPRGPDATGEMMRFFATQVRAA